jgi:hypothetical protein
VLLVTTLVVTTSTAASPPAFAHGDEGTMEVLVAEARSPSEIYVEVGVVYANDDDLATEAAVTVTATGPEGQTVGPFDIPVLEDARYATTVTVPGVGTWTLAVASTGPTAAASATVEVTAESATTVTAPGVPDTTDGTSTGDTDTDTDTDTSTTTDGTDTSATTDGTDTSATTDGTDTSATTTTTVVARDPGEGTGTGAGSAGLVVLAIVTVIIGGGAFYVLRGRSGRPAGPA